MSNTLLYIYAQTIGDEPEVSTYAIERATRRAAVAEALGYGIAKFVDVSYLAEDAERQVTDLVTSDDCVGVWVDTDIKSLQDPARRIMYAAIEAEKPVVNIEPEEQIETLLRQYVKLPQKEIEA